MSYAKCQSCPTGRFFERASLRKGISYGPAPSYSFVECALRGILSVIPLELQEMQHQAFPYDTAQKMEHLSHIFLKEKGCIIAMLWKIPIMSYGKVLWKGFTDERNFIRPCSAHPFVECALRGILSVIPLELQEMQYQAFPSDTAQKMEYLSHIFQRKKLV